LTSFDIQEKSRKRKRVGKKLTILFECPYFFTNNRTI